MFFHAPSETARYHSLVLRFGLIWEEQAWLLPNVFFGSMLGLNRFFFELRQPSGID